MDLNPKVSIIIPVYNGSNYLSKAIDSALAQTYKNIEVIVINDGSNDGGKTEEIALTYGDRIRYFYKDNGGVASALNFGIKEMTGAYFSWLSHDDVYYPEKIEKQMRILEHESQDVVLYSGFEVIDSVSKTINPAAMIEPVAPEDVVFQVLSVKLHLNGCTFLVPKACFDQVGLFDESLRTTQDYEMWFRMIKNGWIFKHMPEVLIQWRIHPEQGVAALKDLCYREQEKMYFWALDLFRDEIVTYPYRKVFAIAFGIRQFGKAKAADYALRSKHILLYPFSKLYLRFLMWLASLHPRAFLRNLLQEVLVAIRRVVFLPIKIFKGLISFSKRLIKKLIKQIA